MVFFKVELELHLVILGELEQTGRYESRMRRQTERTHLRGRLWRHVVVGVVGRKAKGKSAVQRIRLHGDDGEDA